jgi:three-Cys-motif partner protein
MVGRRGRVPMDDRAWIVKHLKPLMDEGKSLYSKSSPLGAKLPTYDKGYWTGLKLILIKYYLKPYLELLVGKERMSVAYVDLFAGPGLDLIGDRRVPVLGSPIIPLLVKESRFAFSSYIFSDTDPSCITALQKRVDMIKGASENTKILKEDANSVIKKLPDLLGEAEHALVFVDPEGMELSWSSVRELVGKVQCDLIINFPSAGLQRNLQYREAESKVKGFLGMGSDSIPAGADEAWAIAYYRSKLANIGKDISTEIMVRSGRSYHYHLIPAVRKTSAGSPWFRNIFMPAKERIERLSGNVLGLIAEQVEGNLESL